MRSLKFRNTACLVALALIACGLPQCTKPKIHDRFPIPPTTRAGSEFFGCKINGLPFTPKAPSVSGLGNCTYKFTYQGDAGYTFEITSNSHELGCRVESITIVLDSIKLEQGRIHLLGDPGTKKKYGTYSRIDDCSGDKLEMHTNDLNGGEVLITKYDSALKFVSGSFFFTVKDSTGNEYRVSEGLFDQVLTN